MQVFKVCFILPVVDNIFLARRHVSYWMPHEFEVRWLFSLGRCTFKIHEWRRIELSWIEWLGGNAPWRIMIIHEWRRIEMSSLVETHPLCSVIGCKTNYKGHEKGIIFPLLTGKEQRQQWIKFLRCQDSNSLKNVYICYKHFAEKLWNAWSPSIIWNRLPTSLRILKILWTSSSCSPTKY